MASHFSEIDPYDLPPEFKPIGAWGYVGLSILFSLPLIGLIFVIVYSFSDANINRRNYARSFLIFFILTIILVVILALTGVMSAAISSISSGNLPTGFQSA